MNKQIVYELNQLIEQKLELFHEIYDITAMQKKEIENNQAEDIQTLVEQKQQVIDKIDKLDELFLTGYKKLKDELQLDSIERVNLEKYPELKNIKTCVEKIMELAREIMKLENSNKEKLDAIFQNIKKELKQVNTGKRSLKAYEAAPVYNDGIYIDKKK